MTIRVFAMAIMLLFAGATLSPAEEAPQKVKDLAYSTLAALGNDAVIVSAVKAENAKGKTLIQIKELDERWIKTPGLADFMKAVSDSECGRYLRSLLSSHPYYYEMFVMDNQGANVAMTDKTSDYWQGDEAKFIKSFNNGSGAVFVDQVKFDESSQAYLVQVSVPVMDGDHAIGAITFGIDIDKVP
ncbi:MAG: PDC sensor domain-containing protein [Desulforhopalus sp.]|nr:PDC sensor domain-containing protein [Desulforhopalus sp.]